MKVLVCGGRDFDDEVLAFAVLDHLDWQKEITDIIHGGAKGADMLGHEWAYRRNRRMWVYKADWDKHGKAAGPIRNQQMLDEGKPDIVVAFPGGRGTADMIRRSRAAGLRVKVVDPEHPYWQKVREQR